MYTAHGYHIPFTHLEPETKPERVVNCGGVRMCSVCTVEAMPYMPAFNNIQRAMLIEHARKENTEDMQEKAKRIVFDYVKANLDPTDTHVVLTPEDIYVVWFAKVLQNWKALISTTLPDGMYYEVTYNGDKYETYLDAYKKFQNVCIPDQH